MSRRNVLLLVLSAFALTAFSFALSRRDSRDWRSTRARRVLPFPWQDVVAVDVRRRDGEKLAFAKTDGGDWRVEGEDGFADTLSPRATEELAAFATLAWKNPLDSPVHPDRSDADVLAFTGEAGQSVSIVLGAARDGLRVAETEGEPDQVYGVAADLLGFLDLPVERLRSHYLVNTGGRRPERIVLSPPRPAALPPVTVVLRRGESGWEVLEPIPWPADGEKVETLLQWLDRLRADSVAAENPASPDDYGFAAEPPFIELVYADPARNKRVEFGGEAEPGRIFVRVPGRTPVFSVPQSALAEIAFLSGGRRADFWTHHYRSRVLDLTGGRPPAGVVVEQLLPHRIRLAVDVRDGPGGEAWRATLEQGGEVREFAVDPPEPGTPLGDLLLGLSSFQIKTFLADSSPGAETLKWTAYPAWRFTCRDRDGGVGPTLTVYAGNAEGSLPSGAPFVAGRLRPQDLPEGPGLACTVSDREAVMEAFGNFSRLLCLPPYRYRTARIIDGDAGDWEKVVFAGAGKRLEYFRPADDVNEQWWRAGATPEPLLDDNNRFVEVLKEVAQLRSEGFVEDAGGDVGDFGLDRPALNAIVYVSSEQGGAGDGPAFTLSLGGADASGGRYARLNGEGPVFVVSAALAEALVKEYR